MSWDREPLEDGDTLDAATWTAQVDAGIAAVNAVDEPSCQHRTFGDAQAGPPIGPIPNDYGVGYSLFGNHDTHEYAGANATWGANLIAYNSATSFGGGDGTGVQNTSDRVVVGSANAGGPYVANGGLLCQRLWDPGFKVGMGHGDFVGEVEISVDIEVVDWFADQGLSDFIMFCLQFQLNGTDWYTIDRTERLESMSDKRSTTEDIDYTCSIRTRLIDDDVDAHGDSGVDLVTGVRAMVAIVDGQALDILTLGQWYLTTIPKHTSITVT